MNQALRVLFQAEVCCQRTLGPSLTAAVGEQRGDGGLNQSLQMNLNQVGHIACCCCRRQQGVRMQPPPQRYATTSSMSSCASIPLCVWGWQSQAAHPLSLARSNMPRTDASQRFNSRGRGATCLCASRCRCPPVPFLPACSSTNTPNGVQQRSAKDAHTAVMINNLDYMHFQGPHTQRLPDSCAHAGASHSKRGYVHDGQKVAASCTRCCPGATLLEAHSRK